MASAAYTVATATPGTAVSSLDLSSVLGAQNAISTIDQAIGQVNVDFRLKLSDLLGWFPSKCEPVSAWKYPRFPYC